MPRVSQTITLLCGAAIADVLDELATLRLAIFAEYPYLYDGERADELAYLRGYADAPDACVLLARAGGTAIGALTGMPLRHEDLLLREAFAGGAFDLAESYYVGELLFLPAWRNRGLGQTLLARLEEQVAALGRYRTLTCATVERPDDHPLRPQGYIPIGRFLARTGFMPLPGVTTTFGWRETDGVKRAHAMQLWLKQLPAAVGA